MHTSQNTEFLDSSLRAIPLRMRPDLRVEEISYQSERYWVVKDPHDQQYFRLNEQEFALLNWLDGTANYRDLKQRFERDFSPYRVDYREITDVLNDFFQKSLVSPTRNGVGRKLHALSDEKKHEQLKARVKNVLAIRWRGVDPSRLLRAVSPWVSWVFTTPCVVGSLGLVVVAITLLLANWSEFVARLPSIWTFVEPSNWIPLGITIIVAKLLHELGHAFAASRYRSECHEIGVMLFFFMPTLYCNTSDSWMLKNKWQRMAIAAAGVYVELILFAVATFGWWYASPGMFHTLCLNWMLICSVSAVLTNGNPLLRYDGYFVLADWLEIPNLAQKSNAELKRTLMNFLMAEDREPEDWSAVSNRALLATYGLAAFAFRAVLLTTITGLLVYRFHSIGLANVAICIGALSVLLLFVLPLTNAIKHLSAPGRWRRVKPVRLLAVGAVALSILALALVPLPHYVNAECTVVLDDEEIVYVAEAGRLQEILVSPGDLVTQGQVLARLSQDELAEQLLNLESQIAEIKSVIQYHETPGADMGARHDIAPDSLATLKASLRKLEEEGRILRGRQEALTIRAKRAGKIFGSTIAYRRAETHDEDLNQIFGNPLAQSNIGSWLSRGDELCRVGVGQGKELLVVLEQRDGGLIQTGQAAKVLINSQSGERLDGRVGSIALTPDSAADLPSVMLRQSSSLAQRAEAQGGDPTMQSARSTRDGQTLFSTLTQARIVLDGNHSDLVYGSMGRVRIRIGERSIAWRARRAIQEFMQYNF